MTFKLILFSLATIVQFTYAVDHGSPIDHSKDIGNTWNQQDSSWCHAVSATDCMTAHLLKKKVLAPGERLHPLQFVAATPLADDDSVVQSYDDPGTMMNDIASLQNAAFGPSATQSRKKW